MNRTELVQRLQRSELDSDKLTTLALDLLDEARYPARLALNRYLSASVASTAEKGMNVLNALHELSLGPLAESSSLPEVTAEVWVIRTLGESLRESRRQSATTLKELLARRLSDPAPMADGGPDLPKDARVCDVAFILLHRMLRLGAPTRDFLGANVDQRDRQIRDLQDSPSFQDFFGSEP
jgi:hypothetical protein